MSISGVPIIQDAKLAVDPSVMEETVRPALKSNPRHPPYVMTKAALVKLRWDIRLFGRMEDFEKLMFQAEVQKHYG